MLNSGQSKPDDEKTRVLVVDDEKSFTRMVKLTLENTQNYLVETINESPRATIAAKAFHPDIVLLDVVMPEADGGDVASALRSRSATKDLPIIFISAMVSNKESHSGFYESGGEHFLAKPVSLETLCGAIETVIAQQGSR